MSESLYQKQWEIDNKERRRLYKQEYYLKNKKEIRTKNDAWKQNNKERSNFLDRRSHLKNTYCMSIEQYQELIVKQNNLCLLCNKPLDLTINNHIDHDHKCCDGEKSCGKCIRGVLHDQCNRYIAMIERYPNLLAPALKYIKFEQLIKD